MTEVPHRALHLVFSRTGLADCLRLEQGANRSTLVLLQDAVYAIADSSPAAPVLPNHCHVLEPDLALRGLSERSEQSAAQRIDYSELVALAASHQPIVSWS